MMRSFFTMLCLASVFLFIQMLHADETPVSNVAVQEPDAPAEQVKLGLKFLNGLNKIPKDRRKAAHLFSKAAEQGDADGQYWFGRCLMNGWGIKKDSAKAVDLFMKAALQGHSLSQLALGCRYLEGDGTPKNAEKAVEWLKKSAEQNCAEAQFYLGDCCFQGTGTGKDEKKAFFWYTKASEQGNAQALFRLAGYYISGCNGIEKDIEKALKLLETAADKGNKKSLKLLMGSFATGYIFYYEQGFSIAPVPIKQDPDKVIKYAEQMLKSKSSLPTDRIICDLLMSQSYFLKGNLCESIKILANSSAKYLFLFFALILLAELAIIFGMAYKLRKSGTQSAWRFGDIFMLAGLFIVLGLLFSPLQLILPFHPLISASLVSLCASLTCIMVFAVTLKIRGAGLAGAFAIDTHIRLKTLLYTVIPSIIGIEIFNHAYTWACEMFGIKRSEQLFVTLFDSSCMRWYELTWMILMGTLLIPIVEELIFRGIIYQALRTKLKPYVAVPISSLVFAAVHMDISAFLPIFFVGCILAYLFERTKSLRVPIIIHCLNNAVSTTIIMLMHGT